MRDVRICGFSEKFETSPLFPLMREPRYGRGSSLSDIKYPQGEPCGMSDRNNTVGFDDADIDAA